MSEKSPQGTVVIGYDKSPDSDRALAAAAQVATASGRKLTIVHAYRWMPPITPIAPPTDDAEKACREAARQIIEEAAASVRARHPGLPVEAWAAEGGAAVVLAEASASAPLLVVGNRGHGGFTGLLLGSVSMRVLSMATCPVLVVRGEPRPTQDRVLAAVDIDGPCDEVLEFAFAAASQRGSGLTVLHVWDEPWFLRLKGPGVAEDIAAVQADREDRLAALVGPWQAKYPEVPVTRQVLTGSVGAVLVGESAGADLVVAGGRRGSDRQTGMLVGPATNTVLHHSLCPVAVVPLVGD